MYTAEGCLHYRTNYGFQKVYTYLRNKHLIDRFGYFLNPIRKYRISTTKDVSKRSRIIRLPKDRYPVLQPQFLIQVPQVDGWLYWINHDDNDQLTAYINGWSFNISAETLKNTIGNIAPYLEDQLNEDFNENISVLIKGMYLSTTSQHVNKKRQDMYDKMVQAVAANCGHSRLQETVS